MRLTELGVADWRNLPGARLETDARFVVLHGDNAQGKTNLLEAVWVLANLRSFREVRQRRLVREGAELARIQGRVQGASGRRTLLWSRGRDGGRALKLDGRPVGDLGEWFAVLRAILFCPEHGAIIRGDPSERRAFVDRAAFTARPTHLDVVRQYRRVVQQKAALLRGPGADRRQLQAWNGRLARLGAELTARRLEVLAELAEPFRQMHHAIAGNDRVDLKLQTHGPPDPDRAAHEAALLEAMAKAEDDELRRGFALVGPHRAELRVRVDGRSARRFASQGQVRSLVLSLKLAELEAARRRGEAPLFLLDDLTSELDQRRMRRLVELLGDLDNQVWITTTDPRWLGPLPAGGSARYRVEGGATRLENTESFQ